MSHTKQIKPDALIPLISAHEMAKKVKATLQTMREQLVKAELARRQIAADLDILPGGCPAKAIQTAELIRQSAGFAVDCRFLLARFGAQMTHEPAGATVFTARSQIDEAIAAGSPTLERDLIATCKALWEREASLRAEPAPAASSP